MKRLSRYRTPCPLWLIRTHKNIRTRHSIRTNTWPGRTLWPRLKETEQLRIEEKHMQAWQRSHIRHYCR